MRGNHNTSQLFVVYTSVIYIYTPRFLFWDARPTFGLGELQMFFPE